MKHIDLEEEIKTKFSQLEKDLTQKEKNDFHFKSLQNFILHIFKDDESNNKKSKLREINLKRNKSLILEYLNLIINKKVSEADSTFLFKNYIKIIGEFMNRNFGFSFAGGKIKYFLFLIYATVGAIFDVLFWFLFDHPIYIFTLLFLIYSIVRTYIKFRNNKLYGPNF